VAYRPAFISTKNEMLIKIENIEFKYFNGFAKKQKEKNVISLHEQIKKRGHQKILEVSTYSTEELGRQLSAFNLLINYDNKKIPLECIFQGSKVFEFGGPYTDIFYKTNIDAKRDKRLKVSGKIIKFKFNDVEWDIEPKTAFYDWLYISTIYNNYKYLIEELVSYDVFTDISFNPKKSINCQAKSCAILVSLFHINKLEEALFSKDKFLKIVYANETKKPIQKSLFNKELL